MHPQHALWAVHQYHKAEMQTGKMQTAASIVAGQDLRISWGMEPDHVAHLHGHHPLWGVDAINSDPAMLLQADRHDPRSHCIYNLCRFFVGDPLVCLRYPVFDGAVAQAGVRWILGHTAYQHEIISPTLAT